MNQVDLTGNLGRRGQNAPIGGYASPHIQKNPWAAIIDVPKGQEHLYARMPAMGGYTVSQPATLIDSRTNKEVTIAFKNGKKVIKQVKKDNYKERKLTEEEALENPKNMFIFLKQYNEAADKKYEEAELQAYRSALGFS